MLQALMQIARDGSYIYMYACTHSRTDICISRVSIALCVILCERRHVFPVCVKLCGVESRKGRISARYRRTQILIESTCIHIDGLAAPIPAWLQRHTHTHIYIGTYAISWAISWTMRWTMHSLSSESPIWKFMRRPTRALNTLLFATRISIHCIYKLVCERIFLFLLFAIFFIDGPMCLDYFLADLFCQNLLNWFKFYFNLSNIALMLFEIAEFCLEWRWWKWRIFIFRFEKFFSVTFFHFATTCKQYLTDLAMIDVHRLTVYFPFHRNSYENL